MSAMEKQAKGAALGYKTVMEENEKLAFQLDKVKSIMEDDDALNTDDKDKLNIAGKTVLATLLEENQALQVKIKEQQSDVKGAERQVATYS